MNKSKVLIADDDEDILDMYSTAFTAAGMEVIKASDGLECVHLALKHHPDVIMVDIMMPKMSGHEAVNKIRLDSWGKSAKIVYLTNMSDAENVAHAVAQGTEKYIVKANTSVKEVLNQVRMAMHS